MLLTKRFRRFLSHKRVAIGEACIIGLVSGLTAVFLKQGVGWLVDWRASQPLPTWLLLPGIGLLGGWLAGWLLERLAPEASGSGIPQVKAVLRSVSIPLNLRVAIVKLLSTTLALGSGLSLGRQGPTVQIGAALAAQLSRWVPTSPEYRKQLIAAGAAAGLAAGFNAPIAGVLFVVEELLQDFSGLALGTAILASFIGAVVSRVLGGQGLHLSISTFDTGLSLQDLPFLILLGLLAGLLGALFSRGIFASIEFNKRVIGLPLPWRIGLAGLVTGLVGVFLPVAAQDNTGLRQFLVTGKANWLQIETAFVVKFGLTLMAAGAGAPGGIFAPTLMLGSALGCLVSFWVQNLYGFMGVPVEALTVGDTTTYALTGMGAFFSAVTRVPITAIVIVFEMTTDFNLVLPLMIGSVVSYLVADKISSGSIYNRLLAWQGIHLEPSPAASNPWANLKAADLMQRRVETLPSHLSIQQAMLAFSRSHHRGFPVLEHGKLVGIVTQTDLSKEQRKPVNQQQTLADVMTPYPVTVSPDASLTHALHLLNRLKISRLPVTEGHKLVGIITRGDIIRAESDKVSGEEVELGPQFEPSYRVYQTCAPAVGQGRLLVPLSDPQTAPMLLELAVTIARAHKYELECVNVIQVHRSISPTEAVINLDPARHLLQQAEQVGKRYQISVHTQIRAAHDVAQSLLEIIRDRHIDLTLMGWRRQTSSPGRAFGPIVETLVRQTTSHVVLVRLGKRSMQFNRWLVPIAGGPNSRKALRLLPALATISRHPDIKLCHVLRAGAKQHSHQKRLTIAVQRLKGQKLTKIDIISRESDMIADTIVQLGQEYRSDVILLGASREGLLSHVLKGNIPIEVAQHSECSIILVQKAMANSTLPAEVDSEP